MPLDNGTSDFYELMKAQIASTNNILMTVGAQMTDEECQDTCEICNEYGYVVSIDDRNKNPTYVCNSCYTKPR